MVRNEAAITVCCDLSGLDMGRPVGAAVYARQVLRALDDCGSVRVVGPERLGEASVLLSLDGRFRNGRRRRVVTAVADLGHLLEPAAYGRRERLARRWRTASAARRSHHLLAPSEAVRIALGRYLRVPAGRVTVFPALPAAHFRRAPRTAVAALRGELGLPERYFVFVGSRSPRKNLGLLAEAWRAAAPRLPAGVGLVLAGPGREGVAGAVDVGWLEPERLAALLSGALAYLSPSFYEGSAVGALEAMACGAPPVVAATGAPPRAAGAAGIVLDPRRPGQWAEAIAALATQPELRAALSAASLKTVAELRAAADPRALLPALRGRGR